MHVEMSVKWNKTIVLLDGMHVLYMYGNIKMDFKPRCFYFHTFGDKCEGMSTKCFAAEYCFVKL